MRTGRAVLAGAAGLVALLLAGIWIVPGLLDWSRYRDGIAGLAASGIGRPVRIGGAVTLHLLPEPVLTAAGIAVDDDGDGVVLTARELRLRVALGPLLAGRVDARDLVLRGADLRLPWPPAPGALAQRPPTWLSGLQARVEDSRIQVGGVAFTGIDAGLATDPDTGTLSFSGVGTLGARAWRFTARLARPGRDGSAGLDISLDGQNKLQDTGGTFSGVLAGDGSLSGRVAGRGPDLSGLMPAPPVPWRAEGRLNAAGGLAVADELALSVAGSPARGAVALRVLPDARLDLSLAAGRLDLDAWLPVLVRGAAPAMPTGIDLSAEAATLAGGTLRRIRGGFDLDRDGVTLRDGQAMLPGDATLTLSGRLPRGEAPAFEGTARLAAPNIRATLDWLAPLLPPALAPARMAPAGVVSAGVAPGALRTADLAGKVSASPGRISLSDLTGTLDGNGVTGGVTVTAGQRLGLLASLAFDRLALDPWLPDLPSLQTPAGMAGALARASSVDADLHLQMRQATLRGLPLGTVTLDAQTDATRLTLRRLLAEPLGGRLAASATVGEGGRVSDGEAELNLPDLGLLRRFLPADAGPAPLLRGPGTLSVALSGSPDALAARLVAEGGGLRLEAQPTVALAARRWTGPVTLHHPGAPRLLASLGLPGTAAWLGDGSFSLVAQVAATPKQVALNRFDLVAGALRASGQLTFENRGVAGQVAAEVLPLPLPYPRGRDPLPVAALRGWTATLHVDAGEVLLGGVPAVQTLSADLLLRDGVLRLPRASASLLGGALSGTAQLDASADPPQVAATASLKGAGLPGPALDTPVDLTGGTLDGQLDLQASGYSPAALLATATGTARIHGEDGTLAGLDVPAAAKALDAADPAEMAAAVRAALTGGATPFSRLDLGLDLHRGIAALSGLVTAPTGEVAVSGSLDLLGLTDVRLLVHPSAPPPAPGPELGLLLTGPSAAQRTPELAGLSRWLASRP